MKTTPFFPAIRRFIASALVSLGLLEIGISSANAHPTLREAVNALDYPRSSQRFLEKGRERLETEIKYLQQNTRFITPQFTYRARAFAQTTILAATAGALARREASVARLHIKVFLA
ncbi:hypothetical protein C7Y66_25575 [Chroococcidiopsis sp. CCALA 051]|uniref:hypothetical protein n=1 Tax=Chroococcidiopsis sp. CCALA 051 TaxID=869949 RepID=UPI000D0D7924|nr:hypothetical protein [Chroococcidiopsis sp. CCALA 051]MBE9016313.1 hypothetical protein [Chroococcidiopsidales cyanobacterium LEGE 13417]PSM46357.1 hypothetical protein C7Y66_25575 [Chroococcidiopsis sp. CCALA 051]